jgi:acyl-CoA synthetase (AMP-forming)/AMP-acid ligase II
VPAAVVQSRGAVSETDLRAFAATRLAAFKVPHRIIISPESLPRNANGKFLKRELRETLATTAAA